MVLTSPPEEPSCDNGVRSPGRGERNARMGTTFTPTTKAAEAPDIEAGIYDARFDGTEQKLIKGGQYTRDTVNGDPKLEWAFTLLDDDDDVMYDDGDPVEVTKLTGVGFNIAAKTVPQELRVLKALCTAAEYAAFEAGQGTKEEDLIGRIVQVEVFVKDNGWPGVGNVLPARKKRTGAKAQVTKPAVAVIDEE